MKGHILDINSNTASDVDLPEEFFSIPDKRYLAYVAVRRQLNNRRRGTAATQERGDVSYSTRKMRPQKGSGRSRQGAKTSNIWKGGAVAFGPHPKEYYMKLNKKERTAAVFSALSSKFREGNVHIVEGIKITGKTKEVIALMKSVSDNSNKDLGTVLLVYSDKDGAVERAARNIPYCKPLIFKFLNTYDLIMYDSLICTKSAVEGMRGWWKR